jgi:hypothetical protein
MQQPFVAARAATTKSDGVKGKLATREDEKFAFATRNFTHHGGKG